MKSAVRSREVTMHHNLHHREAGKEYQQPQTCSTEKPFPVRTLHLAEFILQPQGGSQEIQRTSAAEKSQENVERNILYVERCQCTFERKRVAQKDIRHHRCRDRCQKKRHHDVIEILKRRISNVKRTPANGALKIPATAPAAPHPRRIVMFL